MATIKDIAREAEVSVTTVSNVIHGRSSRVAAETIDRINAIIARNHYTPNLSARSLVNKTSRIIGVINHLFRSQAVSFMQDPFHGVLLGGIEKAIRERGYYMMIRTVADEQELFSLFNNWNLDGVILTGLFNDAFFERLLEADKPLVLLDSYVKNEKVFNVGLDDFQGGFMATEYLVKKGHRNIVFASPPFHDEEGVIRERFKGYKTCLEENGVAFNEKNVYQRDITVDEGIEVGWMLSKRFDITAVFATADILAAGIIAGLTQSRRRIPEDVSVIGFDDLFFSRILTPPLTTIRQNPEERGRIAADTMMDYLEGKKTTSRVVMPIKLIERASVASLMSVQRNDS
ncbi:MAG: LacI family transcriptional regulator [Treponema sp.]|jgi:LacI family transcriptional regulator|nr:LacI family transcriptional regulator [Treponema sp.]